MAAGNNHHNSSWVQQQLRQQQQLPASCNGYNQFSNVPHQQQMQQPVMHNGHVPIAGRAGPALMMPVTFPNPQNGYGYTMPTLNSGFNQAPGSPQQRPTTAQAQAQSTPRMNPVAPSPAQQRTMALAAQHQQQQRNAHKQAIQQQQQQMAALDISFLNGALGLNQDFSAYGTPYSTPPVSFTNSPSQQNMAIPRASVSPQQQAEPLSARQQSQVQQQGQPQQNGHPQQNGQREQQRVAQQETQAIDPELMLSVQQQQQRARQQAQTLQDHVQPRNQTPRQYQAQQQRTPPQQVQATQAKGCRQTQGQIQSQSPQHTQQTSRSGTHYAGNATNATKTQVSTPTGTPKMSHQTFPGNLSAVSSIKHGSDGTPMTPARRLSANAQPNSPQRQGTKRRASDEFSESPQANKRLAVASANVLQTPPGYENLYTRQFQVTPEQLAAARKQAQQQIQQQKAKAPEQQGPPAETGDSHAVDNQKVKQTQGTASGPIDAAQRLQLHTKVQALPAQRPTTNGHMPTFNHQVQLEKSRRDAAQDKARLEQIEEQEQKKRDEAIARAAWERQEKERQAKQAEYDEWYKAQEEARLERERKRIRKEQLRKDESALFRHYDEYLEHFPLGPGEYRNSYHTTLLANRHMPDDLNSDLALAIQYAKDHWYYFIRFNTKEVAECAKDQRKILADREKKEKENALAPSMFRR
ncbi:hypothetical protein EK21DRAFT_108204 [Setomelanomma holmii]|uniref:Uncharacterized protein n=1 Tax=Setomelanomma holmii TaxID=210430 RepID=A0A9P4HIF9_9PLEO|nr:hypothetical protein EK21DRAFT_108204 [Setomelanomma holmii]